MEALISDLDNVTSKYKLSVKSHDYDSSSGSLNYNPLPVSLRLLDTSSIGLNSKLDEYLSDNQHLNSILKEYVGDNYKYILNDNMTTYLQIYKEYGTKNSLNYSNSQEGGELDKNSTKNVKILKESFLQNSKLIQLISLIEYIKKEQDIVMNMLFNITTVNIKLQQYKYIVKKYLQLESLVSVNKLYLFYDLTIMNNNKKIKEKINDNLFVYLTELIFKKNGSNFQDWNIGVDPKFVKDDFQTIVKLLLNLEQNSNDGVVTSKGSNGTACEFILNNIEKILLEKLEDILITELNHLKEEAPSKYELIKKHKFKSVKEILSNPDTAFGSLFSEGNLLNTGSNLMSASFAKASEVDMVLYDFFNDFFTNLNVKIVYLLMLVDTMQQNAGFNNADTDLNGMPRVVKIIESFLLKILKLYLIPSLNIVSFDTSKPSNHLKKDDKLFSLNRDNLLPNGSNSNGLLEEEQAEFEKLQNLFTKVLPGVEIQQHDAQEKKVEVTKLNLSKNEILLLIPSNLLNLKYILPNLTSIVKTLSRFTNQNSSLFLMNFLNDFYINELFNNNINYVLNTKVYNVNITHGDSFFKVKGIIETFMSAVNKILNMFPGIEYQFNSKLMSKMYEVFDKFLHHILDSFKNFTKMFINLNKLTKANLTDYSEILKVTHYIKGSNEFGTVNEKFITSFLDTYQGLEKLTVWFKECILSNISLVHDLNDTENYTLDFEDLKEMWLLNDDFYEYSHAEKGKYSSSIDGILLSTTLNNLFHDLIYNKLDSEFVNGVFKEKMELFSMFALNKFAMSLMVNDDSKQNGIQEKVDYLYLREDKHVDANIVGMNGIILQLNKKVSANLDLDLNKFVNFILLNNFTKLRSYERIDYILHNLKKLDVGVNIAQTINLLSLHTLNVNDIVDFSNTHKDLYDTSLIKHLILLNLEHESGNNKSILQKRLDDAFKKLK